MEIEIHEDMARNKILWISGKSQFSLETQEHNWHWCVLKSPFHWLSSFLLDGVFWNSGYFIAIGKLRYQLSFRCLATRQSGWQHKTIGKKWSPHKNGAERTGYPHSKNDIRPLSHTIHKDWLNVGENPECKKSNYKTLRRKYRYKSL